MKMKTKKKLIGTAFIIPWFIGLILFFVIPVAQTLIFSFHTVTIEPEGYALKWEGFSNFLYAFRSDAEFPVALSSSLLQLLSDVPFVLVFSFFTAVILHKKFRGNKLVKLIFFLTVILSTGVFQQFQQTAASVQTSQLTSVLSESDSVSGMIQGMQIEQYIVEMGMPEGSAGYLVAPMQRLFAILSSSGIQIFIFLAALNAIPPSLYESGYMEGATAWEAFWKITFPMVSPMIDVYKRQVLNIVVCSMAAFPLAKSKAPFMGALFGLVTAALMFTPLVGDIVNYLTMSALGWIDSYLALIIPAAATSLGLFLMRQFMVQIPEDLLNAARIDGTSEYGILFRIVVPNVKPAWLTLAIFSFQSLWSISSSPYIYREELKTLPYALSQVVAGGIARAGAGAAVGVVTVSYTHLDVYKRQILRRMRIIQIPALPCRLE